MVCFVYQLSNQMSNSSEMIKFPTRIFHQDSLKSINKKHSWRMKDVFLFWVIKPCVQACHSSHSTTCYFKPIGPNPIRQQYKCCTDKHALTPGCCVILCCYRPPPSPSPPCSACYCLIRAKYLLPAIFMLLSNAKRQGVLPLDTFPPPKSNPFPCLW